MQIEGRIHEDAETAQPFELGKYSAKIMVVVCTHKLDPGGSIDMNGCRQLRPEFLSKSECTSHVRVVICTVEETFTLLGKNGRAERLKRWPLLHDGI